MRISAFDSGVQIVSSSNCSDFTYREKTFSEKTICFPEKTGANGRHRRCSGLRQNRKWFIRTCIDQLINELIYLRLMSEAPPLLYFCICSES